MEGLRGGLKEKKRKKERARKRGSVVKQKKRSFSYTDPYGMREGCPALLAGTHSFCLV